MDVPAECTIFELQAVVWSLAGLEPEEQLREFSAQNSRKIPLTAMTDTVYSGSGLLPTNAPHVLLADFAIRTNDTIHVKQGKHAPYDQGRFDHLHRPKPSQPQSRPSTTSRSSSQRSIAEQSAPGDAYPSVFRSPSNPHPPGSGSQSRKRHRSDDLRIECPPSDGAVSLMPTIVTPTLPSHASLNSISPRSSAPSSSSASKRQKSDASPQKYFQRAFALSVDEDDGYLNGAARPQHSKKDMMPDYMTRAIQESIPGWQHQRVPLYQPPPRSQDRKPIGKRASVQIDAEAALILAGMPGQPELVPSEGSKAPSKQRGRPKKNLIEKLMQTNAMRAVEGNR